MTITLQDLADDDWLKGYTQMLFTAESHEEVFLSVKNLLAVQSGALQRLAELADRYVDMRDNDRSLEYADHTADRLNGRPTNLDAAIDAALKDQDHE